MKILYLATIIDTINAFLIPHIKELAYDGAIVDAAGNFTTFVSDELRKVTRKIYNLPLQRNPLSIKNVYALKALKKLIKENNYDFVHVHTPVASVIGRLACGFTNTKCFYTAHGFHFYKGAPLQNWLLYYPVEWLLSYYTDVLITINTEDYELAKHHMHAKRVEYLPGVGIDVEKFANVKVDVKAKRKELGIPDDCKLLLSVGELNKNKNHQMIIRALSKLNDSDIHYAICGKGELKNYLITLAKDLSVEKQVHLLGIRNDIPEILKCADVFVHPSLREGLPVAVMEALASGLPCLATRIRGNIDLLQNNSDLLFETNDSNNLLLNIKKILDNDYLKKGYSSNNASIDNVFSFKNIRLKLFNLYKDVL